MKLTDNIVEIKAGEIKCRKSCFDLTSSMGHTPNIALNTEMPDWN